MAKENPENPADGPEKADSRPGLRPTPGPGGTAGGAGAVSGMSRAEQDVVARAYRKVMAKETLTSQEQAAIKRHEKEKEERLRWQYYASIPQKHWRTMSGRQTKVLHEQAERYGLPFGGPTVNLSALARALHDFLADNAVKLSRDDETDPLMTGSGSPALEEYRKEKTLLARLDRLEREGELIPRDVARESLGRIATIVRAAGDMLGQQFGPAAVDLLNEALADALAEIERTFGESDSPTATTNDNGGP